MTITMGIQADFEHRKKVKEIKSMKQALNWLNDFIQKEVDAGNINHIYSRFVFYPDYIMVDYGPWDNFIFFENLPKNYREQLDLYCNEEEKKNARL